MTALLHHRLLATDDTTGNLAYDNIKVMETKKNIKCPFCPEIEKKTRWFLETADGVVVCRDLNNRGYKYRILVVGIGPMWHRPYEKYSEREVQRFISLGIKAACDYILDGKTKAKKIKYVDIDDLNQPDHWHLQVCMQ